MLSAIKGIIKGKRYVLIRRRHEFRRIIMLALFCAYFIFTLHWVFNIYLFAHLLHARHSILYSLFFFLTSLKASALVKIVSCKIVLIICQPLASSLPGN